MAKSKKGGAFERDMCRTLSLWFSYGKRDDIFWRTAGSGARATVRMKQGKMTADSAGDISAIHPSGKALTRLCIFELKRGYSQKNRSAGISLLTMIDKLANEKDPILLSWFKKLNKELKEHDRKFGFIIFKRDRKNICIAFTRETLNYLKERNTKKLKYALFCPMAHIMLWETEIIIVGIENFLRWCEPETITRKIKRRQKGDPFEYTKAEKELIKKWRKGTGYGNGLSIFGRGGKHNGSKTKKRKIKRRS